MVSKKSILLGTIGKVIREGPPKIKPKAPPKIKSKGPYTRASLKVGKTVPTTKEFKARRDVLRGVPKKAKGIGIVDVVGAGAAGFAVGKGWHKKLVGAVTDAVKKKDRPSHQDKARKGAKELIKKQKDKKKKSLKEIFKNKDTMRKAFGPRIRKKNPHGYRGG